MKTVIFVGVLVAMLAVMASLIFGLVNMSKEGKETRKKSNKMMWMRVYIQAIAIFLMFIFAAVS